MTELMRNQTLNFIHEDLPVNGLVRVLWLNAISDRIIVIQIEQRRRSQPQFMSFTRLKTALERGAAISTTLKPDPRSLMSEAQILGIYPPKKAGDPPYAVMYRTYWWSVIEPIINQQERYFNELCSLNSLVIPRAHELGISRQSIYLNLYRYWAAGSVISALLPHSSRCGGKGKERAGKKIKLGRRSLIAKRNETGNTNYALTSDDIKNLQYGWRTFVVPGVSVEAAYDRTIRTFYIGHWEQRDGMC